MADRWHLGIDTATAWLALALWSPDDGRVHRHTAHLGRALGAHILGELDAFLRRAGVARAELGAIGVGTGPGSFTGTRIGVATALALARGLGVPVGGSSTLEALAADLPDGQEAWVTTVAHGDSVHAARFRRRGGELVCLAAPARRPRAELVGAVVEGVAPDAAVHARRALGRAPLEPSYG